jgi:hypothetical protein
MPTSSVTSGTGNDVLSARCSLKELRAVTTWLADVGTNFAMSAWQRGRMSTTIAATIFTIISEEI